VEDNMKVLRAWVATVLIVVSGSTLAYKQGTHVLVSRVAVEQSVLNEPSSPVLEALEIRLDDRSSVLRSTYPFPLTLTPLRLVLRGAEEEDAGIRSRNHFFDPQNGGRGLVYLGTIAQPSPSWILDGAEQEAGDQFFYEDAKALLYGALTGPTRAGRDAALGKTFETLGHVIHHLQDMAQPQHVRNDVHCDEWATRLFESSWLRLPVCPLTGAYRPSAYESFTFEHVRTLELGGYAPVDYATFYDPHLLWRNQGKGIAEFTSRNFLSAGRNFRREGGIVTHPEYPDPDADQRFLNERQVTDPDLLGPQGPSQPLAGTVLFVGTPVTDRYQPSPALNGRTSTYSLFDSDLVQVQGQGVFTLNRFNHAAANDFLLPRAAAYSAGLINYFFRGRIGIERPEEGVYGIIDHATTNAAGQGFGKLKLRLRNASPDGVKPSGERVPQTMQGGTLVAVAKYTLNGCYQPDLTGDFAVAIATGEVFNPAGCSIDQYFAGEEQISQSAAIVAVTLTPTASEFVFDFSARPIPINARDLRIQVVYTGQLGAEADGIAFGGRDISEPTHLVIYNNSDYYLVDGTFYTPEQIRASATLSNRTAGLNIDPSALNGVTLSVVAGKPVTDPSGAVGVNGYVRVAVLADIDAPFSLGVKASFQSGGTANATFNGIWANTTDLRGEPAYITPFGIYRGARVHFVDVVFKANSAAPIADGELVTMSGRAVPDPGPTPIPVRY
jgi:hypothetical protein